MAEPDAVLPCARVDGLQHAAVHQFAYLVGALVRVEVGLFHLPLGVVGPVLKTVVFMLSDCPASPRHLVESPLPLRYLALGWRGSRSTDGGCRSVDDARLRSAAGVGRRSQNALNPEATRLCCARSSGATAWAAARGMRIGREGRRWCLAPVRS